MAEKNEIAAIKALKERTGAGMMDCKHALEACDYDMEKSVDWLREKGITKAAKRANRIAAEGLALVKGCDKCGKGALVEVNCETDFVAGTDKFKAFGEGALEYVMKNDVNSIEGAREGIKTLLEDTQLAVGEKIDFRRYVKVTKTPEQSFGSYVHMGGKIAVLVVLGKKDDELAEQMAMDIAANAPYYIGLDDVPSADKEREQAIAEAEVANDEKLKNKSDEQKANIIANKVKKTLSQNCLLLQKWLLDDSKTVGQVLQEKGNEVICFHRFQVGEGIASAE